MTHQPQHDDHPRKTAYSGLIDIRKLERENRSLLYYGVVVAVIVHIIAGIYLEYKLPFVQPVPKKVRKPIPVDLIVLPPHIQNPFEDWERPVTERAPEREAPPEREPGVAPSTRGTEPFEGYVDVYDPGVDELVSGILDAPPSKEMVEAAAPPLFEIPRIYQDMTITREPKHGFSPRQELVTLEELDGLGIYRGLVIEDPENKQNLKGFLHIPKYIDEMRLTPERSYGLTGALSGLAEAFNRFTGVAITVDDHISLTSPYLEYYPVVYMTSETMQAFRLNSFQAENFAAYLRGGGFAVIDNGRPWRDYYPAEASLLAMLADTFGEHVTLEPLPGNHPVYDCFYDLTGMALEGSDDGLPPMEKAPPDWGNTLNDPEVERLRNQMKDAGGKLFAIKLDGRLAGIYSDAGLGHIWRRGTLRSDSSAPAEEGKNAELHPRMKLGINIMVFALRRREGKATQYTDWNASR